MRQVRRKQRCMSIVVCVGMRRRAESVWRGKAQTARNICMLIAVRAQHRHAAVAVGRLRTSCIRGSGRVRGMLHVRCRLLEKRRRMVLQRLTVVMHERVRMLVRMRERVRVRSPSDRMVRVLLMMMRVMSVIVLSVGEQNLHLHLAWLLHIVCTLAARVAG